jgi:hypothetical protein
MEGVCEKDAREKRQEVTEDRGESLNEQIISS